MPRIIPYVKEFCDAHNYCFEIEDDDFFKERIIVNYGVFDHQLEIFCCNSFNMPHVMDIKSHFQLDSVDSVVLKEIAEPKIYIEKFYDLCFIVNKYWSELSQWSRKSITLFFEHDNYEMVDYLIVTQGARLKNAKSLRGMFEEALAKTKLFFENK